MALEVFPVELFNEVCEEAAVVVVRGLGSPRRSGEEHSKWNRGLERFKGLIGLIQVAICGPFLLEK